MTVALARKAATDALEKIETGVDPTEEKKAAKAALASEAGKDTFATQLDRFDRRHLSTLRTGAEVRRSLDLHVTKRWGDRLVSEITKRDVLDLLDDLVDQGKATTANRTRTHLSKFFGWLVERDAIQASPLIGVKAPAKEKARERVLTNEELRWFWQATENEPYPFGPMLRVLLLTAQRRTEVAAMTTQEIDDETWSMAPERTKNGRAHDVPLSEMVTTILRSVPSVQGKQGYVFTTTGTTPVQGFKKAKSRIDIRMQEIAAEERGERVEIEGWVMHDLRRTAATGMARLGVPLRVTEAVLNHVSGSASGIVSVYQRHDFATEKRQALEAWAGYVERLVQGENDNVVELVDAR